MKRMFQRSNRIGLRTLILIILSFVLVILSRHFSRFQDIQNHFSADIAMPFQIAVDAPARLMRKLNESITLKKNLIHQNEELRIQVLLLQSHLQKMLSLKKENGQLRQLLESTAKVSGHVAVARLLSVAMDPNQQRVIINKGSLEKVFQGQPVLDAFGVMGQVISVSPSTSKILLITDKESAVPVEDYRTGMRAIAEGLGISGRLILLNVPDDNHIQAGDLFVTSGMGKDFPGGYPVGMVSKILHNKNLSDEKIYLTPIAHIDQSEQVLLVWPTS